jgi:hypothetical protein
VVFPALAFGAEAEQAWGDSDDSAVRAEQKTLAIVYSAAVHYRYVLRADLRAGIPCPWNQSHAHQPGSLPQWKANHGYCSQIGFCPGAWPAGGLAERWWVGYAFHS